jgi:dynein light chain LC8-type
MLEGKATIKETDMPEKMQMQAMASASQALDLYDVVDCISIAAHIKKVLILFFFPSPFFFFFFG